MAVTPYKPRLGYSIGGRLQSNVGQGLLRGGTLQILSAITALVSVLVSSTVALFTIRMNREQARQKNISDLTTGILPRRLDALEAIWAGLFALESGTPIDTQDLDKIIRSSMWLPEEMRQTVLAPFINPNGTHDIRAIRTILYDQSGANLLDSAKTRVEGRGN
jgi:hypothetical protein